jgi:mRNA-degrading endonuclease YafQ of YafQ-DinJ toxin-antitoxin module
MKVVQTQTFAKVVKKLYRNQKEDLDKAVKNIMNDTSIGELKVGDLAGVRVYKFKMVTQPVLLAYTYNLDSIILTLLTLGSHENFYRDLKSL